MSKLDNDAEVSLSKHWTLRKGLQFPTSVRAKIDGEWADVIMNTYDELHRFVRSKFYK